MSDYQEGLEEGIKIGKEEAAARIAELEARVAELEEENKIIGDLIDEIGNVFNNTAQKILTASVKSSAELKGRKQKPGWVCPNNTPGCVKNCGNYGCGN